VELTLEGARTRDAEDDAHHEHGREKHRGLRCVVHWNASAPSSAVTPTVVVALG
jgi:hypothetical protein